MSLFGRIRDAIFGKAEAKAQKTGTPAPQRPQAQPGTQAQRPAGQPGTAQPGTAQPGTAQAGTAQPQTQAMTPVDVEEVLEDLAADHGQQLNWRTSIVDLMKLIGLDSSLENRKELADELGYTGAKDGSAEMNIWLHKQVMKKLAENGMRVPQELTV